MFVLKRNIEESILIGGGIEVKVLDIRGRTVHLGIAAPSDVRVMRKEISSNQTLTPTGEADAQA